MGATAALRRSVLPAALLAAVPAACGGGGGAAPPVTLAATTTLEDSGVLGELVRAFRAAHPEIPVRTVTGGTGEVLALARRGDVDLVLSHDAAAESAFVAEGYGFERRDVMRNDFVIAGPPADPAGVRGVRDAAAALRAIAAARAPFVSRGDDSGTHRRELLLWREAGARPAAGAGGPYTEAGVGMGDALRLASARRAYILTDRATFLVLSAELDLEVLVEGDPRLLNRYGLVRVRGARRAADAAAVAEWLTSPAARDVIASFGGGRFGRPLFVPAEPEG